MRLEVTPIGYNYTMALNIKDPETVRLAAEVAALAGESKTSAVRHALAERKERLLLARGGRTLEERLREILEPFWATLPQGVQGSTITKEEEEEILGFGPHGV
jgi:antitoxin VapB